MTFLLVPHTDETSQILHKSISPTSNGISDRLGTDRLSTMNGVRIVQELTQSQAATANVSLVCHRLEMELAKRRNRWGLQIEAGNSNVQARARLGKQCFMPMPGMATGTRLRQ